MKLEGYKRIGGRLPETAALRNVLDYHGVSLPPVDESAVEALLFGLGGGIAFGYFVFEYAGHNPSVYLGTRHLWHDQHRLLDTYLSRLGGTLEKKTATSTARTEKYLEHALRAGMPAIVHIDQASLSYNAHPQSMSGALPSVVVVFGLDEGFAHIDDRAEVPLEIRREELSAARGRIRKEKNALYTVAPPSAEVPLREAVREALEDFCRRRLDPGIEAKGFRSNMGVAGLEKWASLASDEKNAKGWPHLFAGDAAFYTGMKSLYTWIELDGTGGGASRNMFSDFLDAAAGVLQRPDLRSFAARYRQIAGQWTDVAESLFPSAVEEFTRTKSLMRRREHLFREKGLAALAELTAVTEELELISQRAGSGLSLMDEEKQRLLSAGADKISSLVSAERTAIDQLGEAFGIPVEHA